MSATYQQRLLCYVESANIITTQVKFARVGYCGYCVKYHERPKIVMSNYNQITVIQIAMEK